MKSATDKQPNCSMHHNIMPSTNSQTDEPHGSLLGMPAGICGQHRRNSLAIMRHLFEQIKPFLAPWQGACLRDWCSFQAHHGMRPAFLHPVDRRNINQLGFVSSAPPALPWQAFHAATVAVGIFSIFGAKACVSPFPEHGAKDQVIAKRRTLRRDMQAKCSFCT